MPEKDIEIHAEIHLEGIDSIIKSNSNDIEVYKQFHSHRSEVSAAPEIIMAVIAGGSIVIRQLLLSLFEYLKSKENVILQIQIGKNKFYLQHADQNNDSKVSEISGAIETTKEKIVVTKKKERKFY